MTSIAANDPAEPNAHVNAHVETSHEVFGTLAEGDSVEIYTLKNADLELKLTTFGARLVSLKAKDRDGNMGDVVLGYATLDEYVRDKKTYFGAVPGRYANRIAKGQFTLNDQTYQIPMNDGTNALHGGPDGFERHNWHAKEIAGGVEFTLDSPDGDNGFPGNLHARVRYTLHAHTVRIEYAATTDKPTVVNLTNHAYFNLAGDGSGDILGEVVTLYSDYYTPVDENLIPTGELAPVAGTPFDFTNPVAIGSRINEEHAQLQRGWGYDHNFVVRGAPGHLRPAAHISNPASGRAMTVHTTEPGVQFYSGNHLDGSTASSRGAKYEQRSGFCLETQHYPDSPNQPSFPSTELKPGETYHSVTTWTFTTEQHT